MAVQTRELVVVEAKRLFFQFGFRRITMDEIARNLRMSKKTLYALFPTKDDLIREVVRAVMKPKLEKIRAVTARSGPVAEFIAGIIGVFHDLAAEVSGPMTGDMRMMPAIWREVETERLKAIGGIKKVLERGKRRGEIRSDVDLDFFLRIFIQTVNQIGNPAVMMEHNMKPSEMAEQIFGIFFHGIVKTERKPGGAS
ncbi:MAG: TetR/AcrR family transcriptional regulator [Candidatus Aminicenantales bacterium]